jgi:putative acyl-CoA dehydrogenase
MNTAWMTHQISNQFDELENYNLFETDTVLQEILARYGSQDQARLTEMGKAVGSAEYYEKNNI